MLLSVFMCVAYGLLFSPACSNSTSSAVSHIIVNEENTSRTIVHSPLNEEIRPDELSKHKEKMTSMEQYGW